MAPPKPSKSQSRLIFPMALLFFSEGQREESSPRPSVPEPGPAGACFIGSPARWPAGERTKSQTVARARSGPRHRGADLARARESGGSRGFGDRPPAPGKGRQDGGSTARGRTQPARRIAPSWRSRHAACARELPAQVRLGRILTRRRPLPSAPPGGRSTS